MLFGILTILLMSTQEVWGQDKYYSINIYAQNYEGGDGSKDNPYKIATAAQLAKLARDVNNGNTSQAFLGKYFMLTQDIDLSGGIWMPIGKYYNYGNGNGNNRLFFGKFDGNGHVIKNMHIQWEGTDAWSAWGLFSTLQGASSTNPTTVTNLIIENAVVEKKPGFKPYGPGYNVGVVAGEIYGNTELSNIIIRGSEIKDNDETYEINRETKIGGIAGNVQTDGKIETFRIFNIAADTKINMLKKASVYNNKFYIAQGFGRFSYNMNGGNNIIEPTNIYIFGNGLNIENTSTNINKGGITANCQNESNANKYASTWYYTQDVTGGKNLGTKVDAATFANDFVDIANNFIINKNLVEDKKTLYFNNGSFDMYRMIDVKLVENTYNRNDENVSYTIKSDKLKDDYTYTWKVEGKEIASNTGSNGRTITLPLSNKKRTGELIITDGTNNVILKKYFNFYPKYYSIDLYADKYTGGTGTKEDPIIISNDLELAKLARDVENGQSFECKYVKLANDIKLDRGLWMPIGNAYYSWAFFKGKFDGDGHTIDNMHICWNDKSGKWSAWGLFAALQSTNGSNESAKCVVTNLIIDHAVVEKEKEYMPVGQGLNIGILAGEMKGDNIEISNIIIRNSKMTDNKETYTTPQIKVGGIVGNVEDYKKYQIFNLSSDVDINMFDNASQNSSAYLAGGFAYYGKVNNSDSRVILPTNIYVQGKVSTANKDSRCKVGDVIGNRIVGAESGETATWYYVNKASGPTADNLMSNGTQKNIAEFAKTFASQTNLYISTNNIKDKLNWSYSVRTGFGFGSTKLIITRGYPTIITAETTEGNAENEKYFWYTSSDMKNWTLQNENNAYNNFSIPLEDFDQYVYAILEDGSTQSSVAKINARRVDAVMKTREDSKTLYIDITNNIWENNDNLKVTYSWVKNDGEVSTAPTFDKSSLASTDKLSCHVIVTTQDGVELLNKWLVYAKTVVYLCPAGATGTKADGTTISYSQGEDNKDGLTPETAVKTWKGAYSKLEKQGSWDDNIIVLMGKSDQNVTNDGNNGFTSVTFNKSSDWESKKAESPFFRNTTITGSWDGVDYNGIIEMYGGHNRNHSLPIYGDTRFQYLAFNRNPNNTEGDYYDILYCQFYNLEMGEGIQMTNYNKMFTGDGTIKGAVSTSFQIFGGFMDDNRFSPLSTEGNLKKMDDALPHGREGFKIKIKSGHFSSICVGGRQTTVNRNGVMGSPNMPIKCTIDVDIDRNFNDNHNANNSTLDVAIVLAGNHEGAMVGDVDIIIKSGKIGRVVNGSLGARRETNDYNAPYNTFMGRANILIDPAQSENNNENTDINSRVEITEIYGGSTGRGFQYDQWVENPFYGYSTITIKGGTFLIPTNCQSKEIFSGIYGAGAGGMNGIGDDTNHTTDERIPYWVNSSTKSVMAFGNYAAAKANLCMYKCYNADSHTYTEVDPRLTNNKIIIEGGIFGSEKREIDGIYGGGSGYMSSDLWTTNGKPSKYGGNIYGKAGETVASITINGGEFYCKNGIFAGGRGTDYYYAHNAYNGTPDDYQDLGKIYGNVELTINGGTFHCAVFGGGYGVADAKNKNNNTINTLNNMARLYGSSTVKINGGTFFDNIYGGGDMAVVEKGTNVIISDSADIRADVFAGGNGRKKRATDDSNINNNTWKPEIVGKVLGNTNLTFYGSTTLAPYIYGDIYGGGNLAQVGGDTHINMYAANFAGEIFGGGKGRITDNKGYAIAENLYTYADVTGNTFITLAKDQGVQINDEKKEEDNFSINVIWNRKLDSTKKNFIEWDTNKTEFFADGKFLNPHNIYGGGNLACNVTGKATLDIQKGMTPFSLLKTAEWKSAYGDNDNPHFSVFGGGYGLNTTVGNTDVTVNVEGDYSVYDAEIEDDTEQLSKPRYANKDINVFDNSKGIPNFTILGVLGGGYAGTVGGDTRVTIDGKTFIHRVYGGGFGDPNLSSNNSTGMVGGNTEVYVKGGNIYGDVFGGGAGVKPKKVSGNYTYFINVAKIAKTTKVEISDDAHIYGNVYGGGDIANIGSYETHANPEAYFGNKPKSISTLNQTNGKFISYEAKDYKSFVNIVGGNIFGEIFAGGKGLKKADAPEYNKVGRINGNTILHIANTNEAGKERITPMVWNRVYGGCAFGVVDGNTLVHVEGGMLGLNIFGGGYGDIPITNDKTDANSGQSTAMSTLEQVLGKKDSKNEGTYACILGNTKVQIDGGAWLWDRKADKNGNITTWLDVQTDSEKVCENLDEFKDIIYAIHNANTLGEITNAKAKAAMSRIINNKDTKEFFEMTDGDFGSASFSKNHNIFGGGNRACYVGYGIDGNSTGDGTGVAIVEINHSPVTEIIGANGKSLDILDFTTLQGLCWYLAEKNSNNPQFSVFGAGYGANTKVRKAKVYAQTGAMIELNGTPNKIDGKYFRYASQEEDRLKYTNFETNLYMDYMAVSKEDKKLYYGSVDGTSDDADTFRRYYNTRMAWILGIPGFTFQEIHGGGFSGYVDEDTYVEANNQLACYNIYGGGLGAMPYGTLNENKDKDNHYDFGSVGGDSKVFFKSGNVARNVYGGGAGIESIRVSGDNIVSIDSKTGSIIDFPDMARVKGKTEVHVYGENVGVPPLVIDRTVIMGNVYGGGDVANVGLDKQKATAEKIDVAKSLTPSNFTSFVNVRGGTILSKIFAGGKGRTADVCGDYTKLGGIYGNACVVTGRPVMTYPYNELFATGSTTEYTSTSLNPSKQEYLVNPDATVNKDLMPYIMNSVYGGGQNGTIYGNTLVAIKDGALYYNVFGGGWGDEETNTSANITGNTNLSITGGQAMLTSYWSTTMRNWEPATIVGDKTYSPQYIPATQKFKVNHNIYGGGDKTCVVGERDKDGNLVENSGNTYIKLEKGLLHDNTQLLSGVSTTQFFSSNEWKEIFNKVGSPHFCIFGGGFGEKTFVLNDSHIEVAMEARGSINKDNDIVKGEEYKHFVSDYSMMDIVGGGFSGQVNGTTHINGAGGASCRRVFGGGFYSSVKATDINIKAIDCHDIFGGGFMGDVEKETKVVIGSQDSKTSTFGNDDIYIHGNVYGGNDVSGAVNIVLDSNGYFKDNGGTGTNVNIYGGHIYGDVYGAGNGNYLYALDKKGNKKVTVNEYYPVNPNDSESETIPLVYTVPMRETMPSYMAASDAAKIVNINSWRPITNKVNINIKGNSTSDGITIDGDVYGGGNSASVQKVHDYDSDNQEGAIKINIGNNVNIRSVFMGCNGEALFAKSEDNDFMNKFQKLNGDVENGKELNLADSIDWINDPSNKGISTLYLSTENAQRPLVYPHLLDIYFQPVETDIQGELRWNDSKTGKSLTNCTIGTFCCGGNRGNMNVYPNSVGNVVDYTFPAGLVITDKIVGGCNNANYNYKDLVTHEGGYLLGNTHSKYPFIKLTIKNQFKPKEENNAYIGGNVYGGCYQAGTVRGDISVVLQSDMLEGKSKEKLDNSNDFLSSKPQYSALNVYGAGYGMESYVYGNTDVRVAEGMKCNAPSKNSDIFDATGVSANFVYGGGQQGNVIGVTNVDVLNGHIYKAVTGGSYSGYVWGSTQVKVGYPIYYKVKDNQSGIYLLNRSDKNNKFIDHEGNTESGAILKDLATETIKQKIKLISGDIISQAVYESIIGKQGLTEEFKKDNCFDEYKSAPASPLTWDDINIRIGEAIYGGGYSVAQGTSVLANDSIVLKYTEKYNLDKAFNNENTRLVGLEELPNKTTEGFGGNTTILVADNSAPSSTRDHITISHQEMKSIVLPNGTDLFGYYYKHDGNYRFISLQDSYFYGDGYAKPADQTDKNIYMYDSEGGIFGDGHQSYAEGFRSADLTGYGFVGTTINKPKIINTFQRMDILRLEDNCFNVLGARDYATNVTNKTPYSIARVGEIQMFAKNIALKDNKLQGKTVNRARNYMGLANNIHYVGAVTSNVPFNEASKEAWRNDTGEVPASGEYANKSYLDVKQSYIDNYNDKYNKDADEATFQKRNEGTAKNMIGIASGYALKIQNVQELYDANKKIVDKIYYGPIYGVIEMNLIDVRADEGGGYVYADNVHKRENGNKPDFLETTGNFVFPYDAKQNRYIVDDCFPTGFYGLDAEGRANPDAKIDVHYWYVTGFNYYYNAHITGFTYKDAMKFSNDNSDGLTVLAGLKPNQPVTVHSWKMRSGHPDNKNDYSCDLENRNYLHKGTEGNVDIDNNDVAGGYTLRVGGSSSYKYSNPEASDTEDANKGFAAVLPMNSTGAFDSKNYIKPTLPSELNNGDAKISFELSDNVNNTTTEYFNKHLSKKCLATLILKAPAYSKYNSEKDNKPIISKVATSTFFTLSATGNYEEVENNTTLSEGIDYYIKNGIEGEYAKVNTTTKIFKKDADGYTPVNIKDVIAGDNYFCEVPRVYTYTIYLTIEYVQGPNINGNITVDNCALPGEMIRLKKNNVTIAADQAFSANGYYWRIGKRKKNTDGKWEFEDNTEWDITNKATGYDTYKQGDAKTAEGLFKNCKYDKTNDYLDIPAYYFMNGYGVQLGITMNGLDKIFTVDMDNDNEFLIHNYHRMNPHKEGLNLHLAEAIKRAKEEKEAGTATVPLAEPRIYISDLSDLTAFINFIDTIGADGKAPRYGANAQFVLQKDLTVPSDFVCGTGIFQGIFHGNGHVIHGLPQDKSLLAENQGQIYNLGLESGNIAAKGSTNGGAYHCCFEQAPSSSSEASSSLSDGVSTPFAPIVYRMDGSADTHYTSDDFKYGRVAYDLNEYYLRARYSNDATNPKDMEALKYVYDYYANGDYQYANRTDAITGKNTGITYLRTGLDSDLPNYEQAETRHNQAHDIDKARRVKAGSSSASSSAPSSTSSSSPSSAPSSAPSSFDGVSTPFAYEPLFDANHAATTLTASNIMNDFIFWGQKLQATPESCPQAIESHQNCYMTNRVYRTAGYYGDNKLDAFHYNAYNYLGGTMTTYVHQPSITAIDFTRKGDISKATGKIKGIFYPPVDDNAKVFSDFSVKDDVTKNLLVYTNNNVDIDSNTEAYDVVNKYLSYNERTRESLIKGHHVFTNTEGFTTTFLHLVERTADNKNSEGGICENNNFCAPLPFTVTNRAWYVRKPQQYANDNTGAWEGICLPFTVHKVVASINGEITHFYGTPTADELSNPATNTHTLHHEYWLRGLTTVGKNGADIAATFQRPGLTSDGLFMPIAESSGSTSAGSGSTSLSEGVSYTFATPFFIDTYESRLYNKDANPYYATPHIYSNYPLLTSEVPYIVRFPGQGYYEFDLSSKFYNDILGKSEPEQTVAFNAYGYENMETSYGSITIPVTKQMATTKDGYTHCGTFAAKDIKKDAIYRMNDKGNAFISEASTATSVMPFRTYMTAKTTKAKALSYAPSVIKIAESTGIDKITPEIGVADKDEATGSYLIVRPLTNNKVRIESNISTTIYVYTITGQLYRILDVIPGNSVYSGFQQGAYIFGKTKIMVQ